MKRRIAPTALLLIAVLAMTVRSFAQTVNLDKAEWLSRLNAIGPDEWFKARGPASQLAGLPPGKAAAFIADLWPGLKTPAAKDEILRAMFDAENEDSLRIMRIAIDEKSPEMLRTVQALLSNEVGLELGEDRIKLRQWVETHQNENYKDVRMDRVREIVGQLQNIVGLETAERQRFLQHADRLFRSPELHDRFEKSGLFTVARGLLTDARTPPDIRISILQIIETVTPSEEYLRDTVWPMRTDANKQVGNRALVTLANSRYPPAYGLLKSALVEELNSEQPDYRPLAIALASYGDPEAIPFLIGIIAADNDRAVYDVGYFALGNFLTGASYSWAHDGNWWRIWWEQNHSKLPTRVRDLKIPSFAHSRTYKEPMPRDCHLDPVRLSEVLLQEFTTAVKHGDNPSAIPSVQKLAEVGDPTAIPTLIGAIAADNSPEAVYTYGYYGLRQLTGVPYSVLHDGAWWKLWWEEHRKSLPSALHAAIIPSFPHSFEYRDPIAEYTHRSPDLMRTELLTRLHNSMSSEFGTEFPGLCQAVAALKDPRIVPGVIDMIPEDPKSTSNYALTNSAIGPLTGVVYVDGRGRAWWQNWWKQNIFDFEKRYKDAPNQPDFVMAAYNPEKPRLEPSVTEIGYRPVFKLQRAPDEAEPDDIKDVSSERLFANGDKHKLYLLIGLSRNISAPIGGYKLLVVLPGADGSEDSSWFMRRVKKNALPADVLVAELVAPKWSDWQYTNLVWPTRMGTYYGGKFHTEQFIEDVIADVGKKVHIDPANVCTLGWSTSGQAVFTHAGSANTHIRGSFIALSEFYDDGLPDPASLQGRRFYIYHSPPEASAIQQNEAVDYLTAHGAHVKMLIGHGWSGNVYDDFRQGVDWLFSDR